MVDTTGAGMFSTVPGGQLAQRLSPAQAVRFASAVAALKCTQPGGRAGIPDCDQTRSFVTFV